jgi:hypothetical protein
MPSHEPMSLTTIRLDEIKPSNLPNPSIKFYYFSGFVCANANTTQSWRLAEEVRSSICSVVGSRCPVAVACCSAHVTRFPSRRLPQSWNLGQHLFPNRSQRTVASRSRQARERERGGAVLLAPFPCDGSFECSRSSGQASQRVGLSLLAKPAAFLVHIALPLSLSRTPRSTAPALFCLLPWLQPFFLSLHAATRHGSVLSHAGRRLHSVYIFPSLPSSCLAL